MLQNGKNFNNGDLDSIAIKGKLLKLIKRRAGLLNVMFHLSY